MVLCSHPRDRQIYFKHLTMRRYFREHLWYGTTAKAFEDGKLFTNDRDRARACHLVRLAVWTVPMDLAEKWMRKYRARWEETPPVWFTPEWREALPPQLCALLAAEGK